MGKELVKSELQISLEMDDVKERFKEMLGKKAAGFISSILTTVNSKTDLKACNPSTIISAAATAASLDLPVIPGLGMAHLVPYKGVCQFQIGWKGFVQLAMRSGQYRAVNATVVYEDDILSNNRFTGEIVFIDGPATSKKVIGYVAYMKLINGFEKYYYMTIDDAMAHGKKYSQSFSSKKSLWQTDPEKQCLKTVVKMMLSKYGVLSIDMQNAITTDQAVINEDGTISYVDNFDKAKDVTPKKSGVRQGKKMKPDDGKDSTTKGKASEKQIEVINKLFKEIKVSDEDVGRFIDWKIEVKVKAVNELTQDQAGKLIELIQKDKGNAPEKIYNEEKCGNCNQKDNGCDAYNDPPFVDQCPEVN